MSLNSNTIIGGVAALFIVAAAIGGCSQSDSGGKSAEAKSDGPDFAKTIPAADIKAGETIGQRCLACHDWTKGGPNKIGPNLWGVVGRHMAAAPGFTYSPIMQSQTRSWTYQTLFEFLARPAIVVPGTKMTFAGLPDAQDRMNVIAFLRTQADTPFPLPGQ